MKLSLDVMGFENKISESIIAARKFVKKYPDVQIILVGNQQEIIKNIKENEFEIVDAKEIITMDDSIITSLRKTESSMYKAIKLVADNIADGVLSAGNTACYVTLVYYLIKTIPGIVKPGFMPFLPATGGNKFFGMIDVGANKNCSGEDLYNFAKMANIYFKSIHNNSNPKIGIINIGTEKSKGFEYHHDASELLQNNQNLNYVGFVEPRYLLQGVVDIAVCDGYTGNLVLKSLEGGLKAISIALKKNYKKPWNWLGALFSICAIKGVSRTFDYKNKAGAIVLGLNKPAVKTHGSADKEQFFSALNLLYSIIKNDVTAKIKKNFNNEK